MLTDKTLFLKTDVLILLSGVLYAAFFQFLDSTPSVLVLFSFFLPVLFYTAAFLRGHSGVLIAGLPFVFLQAQKGTFAEVIYFFLFTLCIPFLWGYVLSKRQKEMEAHNCYKKWHLHNSLTFMVVSFLFIFSVSMLYGDFSSHVLENSHKILSVFQKQMHTLHFADLFQLIFSITLSFCAMAVFYGFLGRKVSSKITRKKFVLLGQGDRAINLQVDVIFWFFLTLYLFLNIYPEAMFLKIMMLVGLCFSSVPVLYVGVVAIKQISQQLQVSKAMMNFMILFLFFLVQATMIVVLLGLMECFCHISRFVRIKK